MKFTQQYQQYESEITQFIKELKQKNPSLEQQQQDGRALLWDKAPLDLDAQNRAQVSRVQQQIERPFESLKKNFQCVGRNI